MSLYWRIFLLNGAVLISATSLLMLGPATVSTPVLPAEALVLAAGVGVTLATNAVLMRLGLAPLARLTGSMSSVDQLRPGHRLTVTGDAAVADLTRAFNTMLDRLETERAASTARALSAQEAERQRIARGLHDEIGQTLTAVLLELKGLSDRAPRPLRDQLHQAQETTRNSLDEIRRIAHGLRPGVLEELGLISALRALATEFSTTGLKVESSLDSELPELGAEIELVIYRVAQESLTNAARHAYARHINLSLRRWRNGVELYVGDDGLGLGRAREGAGILGMRERALLIGADLTISPRRGGGTEVRLHVPATARGG